MADQRRRRGYLDWMRGLAVLIMIEAHLLDSWTGSPDRETSQFGWAMIFGGLGAPLFLFLAGAAVSLSAGSKARRSENSTAAALTVARRGVEIFGLAFLFRIQAWILGMAPAYTLLKVDILNIMGPSIVAAAALWGAVSQTTQRALVFAAATILVAVTTPAIRASPALAALPDPVEAYLRPIPGLTNFVFFPWMGFVFAGALVGVLLDAARTTVAERRVNLIIGGTGALLAVIAYALTYLPSPYGYTYFWTTSPAFFAMRVGLLTVATALAFAWESRPHGDHKWSPLKQLGRTSLFIYWIHVEMVYGLISRPLHKGLTLVQACAAFVAFALFMLACSIAKDRIVKWWRTRAARGNPQAARSW